MNKLLDNAELNNDEYIKTRILLNYRLILRLIEQSLGAKKIVKDEVFAKITVRLSSFDNLSVLDKYKYLKSLL
jgi:hypothetical protein